MIDKETQENFDRQDKKLDAIFRSTEKTRKYFLWTLIITLVLFFLPLIIFLVFIPQIISVYTGGLTF